MFATSYGSGPEEQGAGHEDQFVDTRPDSCTSGGLDCDDDASLDTVEAYATTTADVVENEEWSGNKLTSSFLFHPGKSFPHIRLHA